MNVLIEEARSDASAMIEEARIEAEAIIERCIGEGERVGRLDFEIEVEKINKEIADIGDWMREEELAIRQRWEKNVPEAVETIIEHVGAGS